ncbi:MAG: hypothetical protein WD049_02955 [Candidatus Paceibacterota bacterium]
MAIYEVYKKLGETPLEALERARREYGESADAPMTYAGRLDPVAEGLLLVLSGEDVHRKPECAGLDKTYTLDVLWGIETDTYDLLGIPQKGTETVDPLESESDRSLEYEKWIGEFEQEYPPYSAQPVHGKPLWRWAREKRLSEITMPTKQVVISSIKHAGDREITIDELLETVRHRCSIVSGDFRQAEIGKAWEQLHDPSAEHFRKVFSVTRFEVSCSSGTYMRSLAHEMGKSLGPGACAYWIYRDRIGKYTAHEG